MKTILIAMVGIAFAGLMVAAPAQAQPSSSCFRLSDMGNHRVADSHTLYVSMAHNEIWRFEMTGACLGGAGPGDPLVVTPAGGGSLICRPIDLDIKVATLGGLSPCLLNSMTRLTPQEAAALPRKLRP
ncbi:hypothetical protein [Phenylobacterium aquaticum]|uniref:hypothetical protein n=2 Tax=Phenylobacterium aquaticum TaxID=1763816 RepID=UPI0026F2C554|nr:hypothetical protein [Phenylobacterium aquaticum]